TVPEPKQNPAAEPSAPHSSENAQPSQSAQANSKSKTRNAQPEQMQYLINQFTSGIVQTAASSMATGQPTAENLKRFVLQQVKALKSNGVEPQPGMWIGIAKTLIEVALQNSVTAEKAAQTISPIINQFE